MNERPTDLLFWFRDGFCVPFKARVKTDAELSIGTTNSKRALGFIISQGGKNMDFVLDQDQVAELAAFLEMKAGDLRKPLGRKKKQISCVALKRATEKQRRA
jgi:hypothetical protein